MKKKIVLLLLLFNLNSFSQEKFSRSIELNTDNDLYVSVKKDRYYTSGVFLKYQFIGNKKRVLLEKRIYEFQIGHEMFSPYKAIVQDISQHDRPFAAHLFTQFEITNTYKSDQILKTSLQFGVIGSSALGKELQDFIHNIYGFQKAIGWKYQIKNALSLNASLDYIKSISTNASKNIDLNISGKGRIGTVYSDISIGFLSRIGFAPLQKIINSIAYSTMLNNKNTTYYTEKEAFFYVQPIVNYIFYDATLQGSFLNTESLVTKTLIPFNFQFESGFQFSFNRVNIQYAIHYQTSKSNGLKHRKGNTYGTIRLQYLFR